MTTVTRHEAETNLSRLIARAEAGEEIIHIEQMPLVTADRALEFFLIETVW